jgi:SecD/SecF fusion protein
MAVTNHARLGLDLRGGTQIVLEAKDSPDRRVDGDTLARILEVLRRRVDQLGVTEPTLQRSGDRRVIVELPGVYDPKQAVEIIGRTAQLAFHPVLGLAEPEGKGGAGAEGEGEAGAPATTTPRASEDGLVLPDEGGGRLRLGPAALTGEAVGDARAELDPQFQARWQVSIGFRGEGGRRWAELTGQAACQPAADPTRRVAIVLDRQVISSPQVDPSVACGQGITGGQTVITGDFTDREAQDLALLVRAGALPVPVEVVEQRTVGPTLGEAAIRASVQAAVVGAALTMLYMIAYYRLLGGLAAVALLAYGLVSFAVLLALRSTLTLPGIAGFVLAIGMAVDANVLVFERMREEHRAGAGLRRSLDRGFSKALSAIVDSSITTLLAAGLLFFLASGAVRGFGVTLSVGVLVSLFTALVVTRVLVELVTRLAVVRARPSLLGLDGGGRLAGWLATRGPDLLGKARWWLAGSLVALVLAGAGLVVRGPSFGVEFTGGRLLEYRTERPVEVDAARQALAEAGFPRAVVQASGDGNLTVRTSQLDEAGEDRVQRAVTQVGGHVTELRDEFIGPTIGAELRRKALIALSIALVVQLGYLAVRFRWTFGAAAVIAMFHDVAILLGLFAWLGKPLDGVLLAALLTVIGYSVNDSVVVFDRIRERLGARTGQPLAQLANDACLQTIPRTVNTGLGALFILAALFVLGGDTLTDFALALLVGILVGTYSSVFVATPLLVAFEQRFGGPSLTPRRPAREPVRPSAVRASQVDPATDGGRSTTGHTKAKPSRPKQRKQPTRRSDVRGRQDLRTRRRPS